MDKYNHWLAKLLLLLHPASTDYAITLGQTTFYSCPEQRVNAGWRAHENCHKQQFAKEGKLKFLTKYLWWTARYGYEKNPYELEAEVARAETNNRITKRLSSHCWLGAPKTD